MKRKRNRILLIALLVLLALCVAAGVYFGTCSPAGPAAQAALVSGNGVHVEAAPYGYLFDGPGSSDAFVFYPGARVEYTAYAPLLRALAEQGIDCFLVKMPLNMAFTDMDECAHIQDVYENDYERWYVGGHSLGGACAALYAAKCPDRLSGLILLAAYATKPLSEDLAVLELHGSEDAVLNRKKLEEGRRYLPASALSEELPGGNHAQFGDYGLQRGDGAAEVSRADQTAWAADRIEQLIFGQH